MKTLAISLLFFGTGGEPATQTRTVEAYFREVGSLVPAYTVSLACAEDEIGSESLTTLKRRVRTWFGDQMVAQVQADYDRVRTIVERTPPSERAAIVRKMHCVENAERLGLKISAAWRDGAWALKQSIRDKEAGPANPLGPESHIVSPK